MKRLSLLLLSCFMFSCNSQDGWTDLFNGQDLSGWHIYNGSEVPNGWYVDNEVLVFDPAMRTDASNASLITDQTFRDFELSIDWMISENGNSGLFWAVKEDATYIYPYETGPEIQMLDDNWTEYIEERGNIQRAGSIFNIMAPIEIVSKPSGEWNNYVLHIDQTQNEGWLDFNGTRVLEFPVMGSQWSELISPTPFYDWPEFGTTQNGHLGLQDHGAKVAFRKIKIRELR